MLPSLNRLLLLLFVVCCFAWPSNVSAQTSEQESNPASQESPSTQEPAAQEDKPGNEVNDDNVEDDEESTAAKKIIKQLEKTFPDEKGLVKKLGSVVKKDKSNAPIKNDAIIFGILAVMLAGIFYTSNIKTGFFGLFYKVIPMLLVCYFLPSLLTFFEVVDHKNSSLYFVATRYLLPATLVLLTLSM